MQEQIPVQGFKESIIMVFNLGVWMKRQKGDPGNVSEAAKELRELIYWNMYQQYGDGYPDDFINANVEYFLEIAILGFILPGVSLPDEELKTRLIALIEAKAGREAPQETIQQHPAATLFRY